MGKKIDLVAGQRFGMLQVLEYVGAKNKNRQWRCVCECGQ
jgi:hypothetical protein